MTREPGFYWVRLNDIWIVAEFTGEKWLICGTNYFISESDFQQINEVKITKTQTSMTIMTPGNRYLIKGWSGFIFEAICLEVTTNAYKIHNVIQKHDDWIEKKGFGKFGDYSIYEDLGMANVPTPKRNGRKITIYVYQNVGSPLVVTRTEPINPPLTYWRLIDTIEREYPA